MTQPRSVKTFANYDCNSTNIRLRKNYSTESMAQVHQQGHVSWVVLPMDTDQRTARFDFGGSMKIRVQPRDIDIPEGDPFANDAMGRKEHISVLTSVIRAIDCPCVLGIDGPWGSGKTTFLRMWVQHLRNEGFPVVSFNAWETDFSGDPFLALSDEISQGLQRYSGGSLDAKIASVLKMTKEVALRATPGAVRLLTAGILDLSPVFERELGQIAASYAQERISAYQGAKQTLKDFRNTLQDAASSLSESKGGRPLVVVIDELDRCRPSYAAELLEIAKHLFAVDQVVFVLAVNRDQLAHSIRSLYGAEFDGEAYLRRFFDIDLRLPDPDRGPFIRQALASIQFDEYFSRTRDRDAMRAYDQIKLLFSTFFAASDISLRTINQAIHHLGLVLATLRPDRRFMGFSAAVALILRTLDPVAYREFMSGQTDDAAVSQRILAKVRTDDESTEHQRALLEAVLIVGALEISDQMHRRGENTNTPLLDRYRTVASSNADKDASDWSFSYAESVLRMVQEFRNEAGSGRPPGFLHAARRLELLSPDLVNDSEEGT